MKINVDAKNVIKSFTKLINGFDSAIDNALQEIVNIGVETAKSKTKGNLAKSIGADKKGNDYELIADKNYAIYVENGRGAIKAKTEKGLVFVINGRKIYTKQVRAAKAQPFMKPAGSKMNSVSGRIVIKHINKFLR